MDFSFLGFHGLKEVFNVHPVFVHFPIVLFPLSLLFYLLGMRIKQQGFRLAAQLILVLAAVSAMVTLATGLIAEDSFPHNEIIHAMMQTHKTMAYFIVSSGVIMVVWSFIRRESKPCCFIGFIGILALVCLAVLLNADLGGRMVFVEGAAVKAMPTPQEEHHEHGESEGENSDHHHGDESQSPHHHEEENHENE
jgi:uncharacterized membrane protein